MHVLNKKNLDLYTNIGVFNNGKTRHAKKLKA